jgi:hypothetical protein
MDGLKSSSHESRDAGASGEERRKEKVKTIFAPKIDQISYLKARTSDHFPSSSRDRRLFKSLHTARKHSRLPHSGFGFSFENYSDSLS